MKRFAQNIGVTVFSLWLAVTLVFMLLRLLPGDGMTTLLRESGASESVIAERRAALGLDAPIVVQYVHYIAGLLQGELGVSLLNGQPVGTLIAAQLPATTELAAGSLLVGLGIGIALAVGMQARGIVRRAAALLAALALALPVYWSGTIAVFIFAAQLNLLPSGGAGRVSQLVLPALVLGFSLAGGIAQVLAQALAEAAQMPHVVTARAKGLGAYGLGLRHVFRLALPTLVTQFGVQTIFVLGGAVVTETLFARPGIGRLLLDAVLRQDYPLVQGIAVWTGAMAALVTLMVDGVNQWLQKP
jgi:peptide/nickel transport system permease protein